MHSSDTSCMRVAQDSKVQHLSCEVYRANNTFSPSAQSVFRFLVACQHQDTEEVSAQEEPQGLAVLTEVGALMMEML